MKASKRIKRLVEEQKASELLPGIPHDITLCVVIPNLSWRDLRTLFSVSPTWQQEIQSRQVYHIRRSTQSTEDLAVIRHFYPGPKSGFWGSSEDIQVLSLYSARDKCCYDLPTIPFPGGIRIGSQFIALDGEIYILGGRTPVGASRKVYVLDVAGQQREWKRCASMREPRVHFGVGVLNGKIYVFGGRSSAHKLVLACEMYDPKLNTWSSIAQMTKGRVSPKVAVIGEELFVYGGRHVIVRRRTYSTTFPVIYYPSKNEWIIYHPSKNEWRQMQPPDFTPHSRDIFMARGKFHAIDGTIIKVYNSDEGLWNFEQSRASIPSLGSSYSSQNTTALGDELLAYYGRLEGTEGCLYHSTGFGKDTEIVWEKANCSFSFKEFGFPSQESRFL